MIGAVGVSLFLLGLEITLPSTMPHLSLSALFESSHLPMLAASLGSAIFLSSSTRFAFSPGIIKDMTERPLYVPVFCLVVGFTFWIIIAACGIADLKRLASVGWLFAVEASSRQDLAANEWNYWKLFDFGKIEWRALSAGVRDTVLLVVIGALSLPIFASATALELDVLDYSMDHEFVGHGISNLVAGAIGTLPNLLVC